MTTKKPVSIKPAATGIAPAQQQDSTEKPVMSPAKAKAQAEKQTAALRTRLFEMLNDSDAAREFLEAVTGVTPAWFELVARVAKLAKDEPKGSYDHMCLLGFVRALEEYDGSATPAAEFILSLAANHGVGWMLTPDQMDEDARQFRTSFECTKQLVTEFLRTYPELVGEVTGAADSKGVA